MFSVIRKKDEKLFFVYAITNDKNGYPHFLIFDNQWTWKSAKFFVPVISKESGREDGNVIQKKEKTKNRKI